jgi:hypothetical protein
MADLYEIIRKKGRPFKRSEHGDRQNVPMEGDERSRIARRSDDSSSSEDSDDLPDPVLENNGAENAQQSMADFLSAAIAKTTQVSSRKQMCRFNKRFDKTDQKIFNVSAEVKRQAEAITQMEERLRNEFAEEIKSVRDEAVTRAKR